MTTFASVFYFRKMISNLEFPFVWMNFIKASSVWQVAEKLLVFFLCTAFLDFSLLFFFPLPRFQLMFIQSFKITLNDQISLD